MKNYFLILSAIIMVSCGTTQFLALVASDIARGAEKYPDLTLKQHNEGK